MRVANDVIMVRNSMIFEKKLLLPYSQRGMFTKFGDKEKIKDSYLIQTSIIMKSSTQVHVTLVARYNAVLARVIVTKFGSCER